MAKEFIVDLTEEKQLFIGVIKRYNERLKKFDVYYPADKTTEHYTFKQIQPGFELFESWYSTVSNGGQRFTRKQACRIILKSYRQQRFLDIAKESHPSDSTTSAAASSGASAGSEDTKAKLGTNIACMKVAGRVA